MKKSVTIACYNTLNKDLLLGKTLNDLSSEGITDLLNWTEVETLPLEDRAVIIQGIEARRNELSRMIAHQANEVGQCITIDRTIQVKVLEITPLYVVVS